jgi:hypothetical protein
MDEMEQSSQQQQQHRRMVVLAGPHKSASSSVQELFMKYASNSNTRQKHPSLQEWIWPWNPRRRSYLPRKGFAPLVTEEIGFHRLIWDTILQVWNATNPTTGTWEHPHLIWGTEELDRFGPVPWSHRDGLKALYQVWNLTRPSSLDIVVHYRRPRKSQWISIWKQLERREQDSNYSNFLCDAQEYTRLWEYLDCVANPLGLTKALLEYWNDYQHRTANVANVTVHLLDMQGIAQVQRDVGHIVACDVLGVKCTANHWLPQVQEEPILQNAKSGNPGLSKEQLLDLEWILRQRDCWYRAGLEKWATTSSSSSSTAASAPRLKWHYAETLWDQCDDDGLARFANTTFLLDVLQSQVGCGTMSASSLHHLRLRRQANRTTTSTKRVGKSLSLQSAFQRPPEDPNLSMVRLQGTILSVLLLGVIGWLWGRRFKIARYFPPGRRPGQSRFITSPNCRS